MSDESSLSLQLFITPIRIHLNLHPELFGEKGMEKEIVISLEIFDSDSFSIQPLKLMEYGKIVLKSGSLLVWKKISETKEEFEEIAKNHQMVNLVFLQIEESGKDLHRLRISSSEMRIGDKNPILSGPSQYPPSPSNATIIKPQPPHLIRVINISQIDEEWGFEQPFDALKIQTAELIPLCG